MKTREREERRKEREREHTHTHTQERERKMLSMSLSSQDVIDMFEEVQPLPVPSHAHTYKNVLKCSTGGRIRSPPSMKDPSLLVDDMVEDEVDWFRTSNGKRGLKFDESESSTKRKKTCEPFPGLSLEQTVMLFNAIADDESSLNDDQILTDEQVDNLLRCV